MTYTDLSSFTTKELATTTAAIGFKQPITFDSKKDEDGIVYITNDAMGFDCIVPPGIPEDITIQIVAAKFIAVYRKRTTSAAKLRGGELTFYKKMTSVVSSLVVTGQEYVNA